MTTKRVLVRERVRQVPRQFGWIDRRLVREGHLARCDAHALALYLFLVTVADHQRLSYYGEASLSGYLSMTVARLAQARADLTRASLIAYRAPLYQVLSVEPPLPPRVPGVQPLSVSLERWQRRGREVASAAWTNT